MNFYKVTDKAVWRTPIIVMLLMITIFTISAAIQIIEKRDANLYRKIQIIMAVVEFIIYLSYQMQKK